MKHAKPKCRDVAPKKDQLGRAAYRRLTQVNTWRDERRDRTSHSLCRPNDQCRASARPQRVPTPHSTLGQFVNPRHRLGLRIHPSAAGLNPPTSSTSIARHGVTVLRKCGREGLHCRVGVPPWMLPRWRILPRASNHPTRRRNSACAHLGHGPRVLLRGRCWVSGSSHECLQRHFRSLAFWFPEANECARTLRRCRGLPVAV